MKLKTMIYIIVGIIGVLSVIALIIFFNYDNILKYRYKLAVEKKDCEKIYNMISTEDGEYLKKDKFISQCKLNIEKYDSETVEMVHHKIQNNIVQIYHNVIIQIPSDSQLFIDDELISSDYTSDSNNIYYIFKMNKMYEGDYNIKFKNKVKEEEEQLSVVDDNMEKTYEYHNPKQQVTIISSSYCNHCTDLFSFLEQLDSNIFETKIYDYSSSEGQGVIERTQDYFNETVMGYPTVIIGNQFLVGHSEELEQDYVDAIYYAYRNQIETVIK